MIQFALGRSYVWLFLVFGVVFFGGFGLASSFGNESWGIVTMPAFFAILLSSELRSGIALDSWWRASHPKGTPQYQGLIALHGAAIVLFSIFAYLFIM